MRNRITSRLAPTPALLLALACVWAAKRSHAVGNDKLADAWVIAGAAYTTNSSNADATAEPGEPAHHGSTVGHTVWWRWTAPASGPVQLSTLGSNFRAVLGVYTGAAVNALTKVASGRGNHVLNFIATGGTTYQIALDSLDPGSWGDFVFNLSPGLPPPANDAFANAALLSGTSATVTGASVVGATKETGEPNHAGNTGGKSVWWKWTAPVSALYQLDTAGSVFDTLLAVYTGAAVSSLTLVAANDNSGGPTSLVSFSATAGTAYYFAVDGWEGREGAITLHLVGSAVPNVLLQGLSLAWSNGQPYLSFQVAGPAGRTVVVQAKPDLSQATWTSLQTNGITGGSLLFTDSVPATGAQKFYRAWLP
jgi:hypothetical protein